MHARAQLHTIKESKYDNHWLAFSMHVNACLHSCTYGVHYLAFIHVRMRGLCAYYAVESCTKSPSCVCMRVCLCVWVYGMQTNTLSDTHAHIHINNLMWAYTYMPAYALEHTYSILVMSLHIPSTLSRTDIIGFVCFFVFHSEQPRSRGIECYICRQQRCVHRKQARRPFQEITRIKMSSV